MEGAGGRRGVLPEEAVAEYEKERKGFEALQRGVAALGEVLDRQPPPLPQGTSRMTLVKKGPGDLSTEKVCCGFQRDCSPFFVDFLGNL
jgi:hypothetical protein